ncbi:MAG: metallophosphoesterase [Candidatus Absconditabacteria bacterium]|nr:metallophosphoesterase [Candidatus Absconditabacteria bacterium]
MLLIGDIHITSKHKDRIIQELKKYIESNSDEQNIIFLGDYVYHFSYDRTALLSLYHFFVELFEQGKNVYILAGNHDRLGNSFVFEEAQKAFQIIQKYDTKHKGNLHFITQPTQITIENQSIILFPFMLQIPENQPTQQPDWLKNVQYLETSSNKNEQISWKINNCLATLLEKYPESLVIHHYYFNKTKLPGQKSQFSYKDIALSQELLDFTNTQFISGHLHQACSYKNYLCTGSIRSTSPLEINQEKFLFQYDTNNNTYKTKPIRINPYLEFQQGTKITEEIIKEAIQGQITNSKNYFLGTQKIEINNSDSIPLQYINITIVGDSLDYDHIQEHVNETLLNQIGQIKLKKQSINTNELLEKLQLSSQDNQSFADRKQLLKDYILQKYQGEYGEYETILQELKVL